MFVQFETWLARFPIRYAVIMRIAAPHVFPKAHRVLLHTGVHTEPSHQRNKLHAGRHATETLHKVATTWQRETGEGAAKKHRRADPRKESTGEKERKGARGSGNNEFATGTLPRRVAKRVLPAGNDCRLARANSTRERTEGLCGSRVCYWLA